MNVGWLVGQLLKHKLVTDPKEAQRIARAIIEQWIKESYKYK